MRSIRQLLSGGGSTGYGRQGIGGSFEVNLMENTNLLATKKLSITENKPVGTLVADLMFPHFDWGDFPQTEFHLFDFDGIVFGDEHFSGNGAGVNLHDRNNIIP